MLGFENFEQVESTHARSEISRGGILGIHKSIHDKPRIFHIPSILYFNLLTLEYKLAIFGSLYLEFTSFQWVTTQIVESSIN